MKDEKFEKLLCAEISRRSRYKKIENLKIGNLRKKLENGKFVTLKIEKFETWKKVELENWKNETWKKFENWKLEKLKKMRIWKKNWYQKSGKSLRKE